MQVTRLLPSLTVLGSVHVTVSSVSLSTGGWGDTLVNDHELGVVWQPPVKRVRLHEVRYFYNLNSLYHYSLIGLAQL